MAMDEMSFVVTTLERINSRLDKHDDKLDMIVQVMQQLVKVDTETKELRESLTRNYKRLESVEHAQNTEGCQAHKSFLNLRNEQLKGYELIAKEYKENYEVLEERIVAIEDKPKKRVEVAIGEIIKAVVVFTLGAIAFKLGISKT